MKYKFTCTNSLLRNPFRILQKIVPRYTLCFPSCLARNKIKGRHFDTRPRHSLGPNEEIAGVDMGVASQRSIEAKNKKITPDLRLPRVRKC